MSRSPQRFARIAVLATAFAILSVAWAGEYFEGGGAAIRGHDPIAYFKDGKPAKGSAEHRFEHKGSVFLFASKANRDAFAAAPDQYAPQYGGFCAFGTAAGDQPIPFGLITKIGKAKLQQQRA